MICTSKLQNNIINGLPILDNPTQLISFMFRTLLVMKLLKYLTPGGGHLGFVQNGCHRGSPSWLPREIGRLWPYLALVQNWCLWNDVNNHGVFGENNCDTGHNHSDHSMHSSHDQKSLLNNHELKYLLTINYYG